ncbi:unnamed protein product [Urochloa humidicola]
MAAPPPPPVLRSDLVEEILLRVPTDGSAGLVRVALVSSPAAASAADSSSRLRELHGGRVERLLGFLLCEIRAGGAFLDHLVPTASSSRPPRAEFPDLASFS